MVDEFSEPLWKSTCSTPSLIEVVGIAENCFVFVAGMNGSGDELVMFCIIADFDKRLRIYIQVRRPIHEPDRKKVRLFR